MTDRGKTTSARSARKMDVKDFGGDQTVKKKLAGKRAANNNVRELVRQWNVLDSDIKEKTKRRDALRTAILELSRPDSQEDAAGHRFAKYGSINVKHELRRSIKARSHDQVDRKWLKDKGIKFSKLFPTQEVRELDEGYLEQLITEGIITVQEAEENLLTVTKSVALKIYEDDPNPPTNEEDE